MAGALIGYRQQRLAIPREAISWVAGVNGDSGDDVRDAMLEAVEKRFRQTLPIAPIQWLSDNGSAYTAEQTRTFVRQIGLLPLTTLVCSPQSNGMAESFVKTMKRDYIRHMPKPDLAMALRNQAIASKHYHEERPHSTLNTAHLVGSGAWGKHQLN